MKIFERTGWCGWLLVGALMASASAARAAEPATEPDPPSDAAPAGASAAVSPSDRSAPTDSSASAGSSDPSTPVSGASEQGPAMPNLADMAAQPDASQSSATPYDVPVAPRTDDDEAGGQSSTDWQLVGGIAALVGGAAFLVVGHYALFRLNDAVREDTMDAYRLGVPEGQSSCELARAGFVSSGAGAPGPDEVVDLCDEADTLEVVRNVALPIGIAATVGGLLLIGTSDSVNGAEHARAWGLHVGLGPSGGAAAVAGSF